MIRRLRVRNFKSILDVTVDLSPVTVLVGKSGTGKSNLVQSLRFLRDVLFGASWEQVPWAQLRPAFAPENATRFDVDFSIGGIEDTYCYQLEFGRNGPHNPPIHERLDLGKRCLFHQAGKEGRSSEWVVKPELVQVPPAGNIALGRIPSISDVVIAFTALTAGIGCYLFSDTVLTGGRGNSSSSGLDDHATNYLPALKEIISNLQDLSSRRSMLSAIQRVNSSVSAVELDDIRQPNHVVVGHKFDGKTLSLQLSQESDGLRRFYAHLLALYQRPPKQTLVFEHPEDGIHPGALSLLAEEFKSAHQHDRGQVILTTHSPKLLEQFEVEEIRVVELHGLETRIGPVSAEQKEAIHNQLLDPGELLTVDPARIQPEAARA